MADHYILGGLIALVCTMAVFFAKSIFALSSKVAVLEAVLDIKKGAFVELKNDMKSVKEDVNTIKIALAKLSK